MYKKTYPVKLNILKRLILIRRYLILEKKFTETTYRNKI